MTDAGRSGSAALGPEASGMIVRFWGVRGSIPTPGRGAERFGGNTTCVEVRYHDTIIVLDAGSGIRELGLSWRNEFGDRPVSASLLFTHVHWDHIQGFPFFAPAYRKGNSLTIIGEDRATGSVQSLLDGQMQEAYFPAPLSAMEAGLEFRPARAEFSLGPIQVRTFPLPHPGGCLGYRLEAGGAAMVFATDCELDKAAKNLQEVRADRLRRREYDAELLRFFDGVHLAIIDCQYPDDVYPTRVGWGHNSMATVIDLCGQIDADMVALFHHDPEHDDDMVSAMTADAHARLQAQRSETMVLAAREGVTLRVEKPQRPPTLPSAAIP
jgi:phosphoribosyl 1,2-cyclic phosphodiesterase